MKVAALYVDPNGAYAGLPDVEVWDEARDARTYAGPWPVVAHPPCASWSLMGNCRPEVKARGDGGTFTAALSIVRRFGGVLEQPAHSRAWDAYHLPEPLTFEGWTGGICGGFACYVEQGRYGDSLRKPTWLYAYGVDLPELKWGRVTRVPEDQRDLWHGQSQTRNRGTELTLWSGTLPYHKRSATPPAFRDVLLAMARSAQPSLAILPEAVA